jgi:hypothetical protein
MQLKMKRIQGSAGAVGDDEGFMNISPAKAQRRKEDQYEK